MITDDFDDEDENEAHQPNVCFLNESMFNRNLQRSCF